jgi:hypothetical protein
VAQAAVAKPGYWILSVLIISITDNIPNNIKRKQDFKSAILYRPTVKQ